MWRESLEADARAPLGEPLAELLGGETAPALVEQERDVLARCRSIDGLGEFGGDWDREPRLGLLRRHLNRPVADMTAPELDDIGAAQRRAEQKLQGQSRPGAHGEGVTERGNVLLGPGLVAVALRHFHPHVSGGIVFPDSDVDRIPDDQPQAAQEVPGRRWRLGLGIEHLDNVLAGERGDAHVAVVAPHRFEDAPVRLPRGGREIVEVIRPDNLIHLRWRNYRPEVEGGIIEYLPKRKNLMTGEWLASEHKIGWHFNVPYIVPLTKNLRNLIEEQRQQQIK